MEKQISMQISVLTDKHDEIRKNILSDLQQVESKPSPWNIKVILHISAEFVSRLLGWIATLI